MNEMNVVEQKVKEVIQDVHSRVFQGSIPERVMNNLVTNISKVFATYADMKKETKKEPTLPELSIKLGNLYNI